MRTVRFPAIFVSILLCAALLCPLSAFAAQPVIDTANASDGYFTVNYDPGAQVKMKVGVTKDGSTSYYTYVPGDAASYAFTMGDGTYTISLYRNLYGITYTPVTSTSVYVSLADQMSKYLVSTDEVSFSAYDSVGQKAAELSYGLSTSKQKIASFYRFMAGRYTYDKAMGVQAINGQLTNYVPNTARTLSGTTGICYDFSALFAAMCRSQGIPCAIARGYLGSSYHAWNMVYIDGQWQAIDITRAVCLHDTDAWTFSDCVISLDGYWGMSF